MTIPAGIITIWSGAIVDIPVGWLLCDGNNGTPDLLNLFVVGAGDTYAVNDSGGALVHTHGFTSDGHQHTLGPGTAIQQGANISNTTSNNTDTGTTGNGTNLPPFYALAYIMRT